MLDCEICGKYADEYNVFFDSLTFSLCSKHHNEYIVIFGQCEATTEVQSLIRRLVKNKAEYQALKILYSGKGPEYFRELTDRLIDNQNETKAIFAECVVVHDEVMNLVSRHSEELPPPHSLPNDHIEDH